MTLIACLNECSFVDEQSFSFLPPSGLILCAYLQYLIPLRKGHWEPKVQNKKTFRSSSSQVPERERLRLLLLCLRLILAHITYIKLTKKKIASKQQLSPVCWSLPSVRFVFVWWIQANGKTQQQQQQQQHSLFLVFI